MHHPFLDIKYKIKLITFIKKSVKFANRFLIDYKLKIKILNVFFTLTQLFPNIWTSKQRGLFFPA